jgi:murein DD-endopeptidase MepM/ murein hydrolase activator NlpD
MVKMLFPLKTTKKVITSDFGPRRSGYHYGVDYAAAKGTMVLAAWDGVIVGSSYNTTTAGNTVVIKHSGYYTAYYHLSVIYAKRGQKVKHGDLIALSGNTGGSTGPHLHFMVSTAAAGLWLNKSKCINPESLPMRFYNEPIDNSFKVRIIDDNLNVRKGPSTLYKVVDTIKYGTVVKVLRQFGTWGQLGTGRWISVKPYYVTRI